MNNFWSLVGFEYKKIFVRKSVFIAMLLLIAATLLSTVATVLGDEDPNDPNSLTRYEEMLIYKEHDLALSGRELTGDLIFEAASVYATIPDNVYPYTDSEEYQTFAMPYSKVFTTVDSAYTNRNEPFGYKEMGTLTKEQAGDYYNIRSDQYRLNLENNPLFTQENVERIIAIDSEVQKPIVLEYADGYMRHIRLSTSNTIVFLLFIAFVVAPIFSGEHQTKTANLILTSKNGKRETILAKFFVAMSIGAGTVVITSLLSYFGCMIVYGFEGANASIQNLIALITYDFTLLEVTIALFTLSLFSAFLMTSIALFASSAGKKNSISLILSVLIIFLEISGLGTALGKVQYFLPSAISSFNTFYLQLSFNVFGMELWLYQAVCIVSIIVGGLLLLLTYRNFKQHQVG